MNVTMILCASVSRPLKCLQKSAKTFLLKQLNQKRRASAFKRRYKKLILYYVMLRVERPLLVNYICYE